MSKTYIIVEPIFNGIDIPIPKYKRIWERGLRVKKIGADMYSLNNRFGIYIGEINNKFCVGRYTITEINITDIDLIEAFDSQSELMHNWEID